MRRFLSGVFLFEVEDIRGFMFILRKAV